MQISTWPSLNWKSLGFKNLDPEKKISSLDRMDNLDIKKKVDLNTKDNLDLNLD